MLRVQGSRYVESKAYQGRGQRGPQAADWLRLAEAWGSLRHALSLRESLRRASWPKPAPPRFQHRRAAGADLVQPRSRHRHGRPGAAGRRTAGRGARAAAADGCRGGRHGAQPVGGGATTHRLDAYLRSLTCLTSAQGSGGGGGGSPPQQLPLRVATRSPRLPPGPWPLAPGPWPLAARLLKRVTAALHGAQARLKRAGGGGAGAGAGAGKLFTLPLLKVSTEESSHSERVASVAFSPDGKTILSGSHDKSIATWDADAVLLDAKEG